LVNSPAYGGAFFIGFYIWWTIRNLLTSCKPSYYDGTSLRKEVVQSKHMANDGSRRLIGSTHEVADS